MGLADREAGMGQDGVWCVGVAVRPEQGVMPAKKAGVYTWCVPTTRVGLARGRCVHVVCSGVPFSPGANK